EALVEQRRRHEGRLVEEAPGRLTAQAADRVGWGQAARVQLPGAGGDDDAPLEEAGDDFLLPAVAAGEDGLDERAVVELRLGDAVTLAEGGVGGGVVEEALAVVEEVARDGRRVGAERRRGHEGVSL